MNIERIKEKFLVNKTCWKLEAGETGNIQGA